MVSDACKKKSMKFLNLKRNSVIVLLSMTYEHLYQKTQIVVQDYVLDDSVDAFFEEIGLDTELSPKDTVEIVPKCPKLNTVLKHSTKQRTYFFSIQKCGESTAHHAKNHDCLLTFSSKLAIYLIQYQMKATLVITRSSQICMTKTQQRNSSSLSALPRETTQFCLIR